MEHTVASVDLTGYVNWRSNAMADWDRYQYVPYSFQYAHA